MTAAEAAATELDGLLGGGGGHDHDEKPPIPPAGIEPWKAWTVLMIAICLEVSGTICMKFSDGYSKLIPSVLLYVFYTLSLAAFPIALQGIELSTAYAIWSGVGTVLTVTFGMVWFKDTVNTTKVLSLIAITAGCVAIRYADGVEEQAEVELTPTHGEAGEKGNDEFET